MGPTDLLAGNEKRIASAITMATVFVGSRHSIF
jgi:hypothetical protein